MNDWSSNGTGRKINKRIFWIQMCCCIFVPIYITFLCISNIPTWIHVHVVHISLLKPNLKNYLCSFTAVPFALRPHLLRSRAIFGRCGNPGAENLIARQANFSRSAENKFVCAKECRPAANGDLAKWWSLTVCLPRRLFTEKCNN